MPIYGDRFDLLGVTVGGAGPFRSAVHVGFENGVSAFYGLNGAGKTWMLKSIKAALTGVKFGDGPDVCADVHIRVHDPHAQDPSGLVGELRDALLTAFDEQRSTARRAVEEMSGDLADSNDEVWRAYEDLDSLSVRPDLADRLAAMVAASAVRDPTGGSWTFTEPARAALLDSVGLGLITLRAAGSTEAPGWDVYLPLSTTSPRSRAVLADAAADLQQLWRVAERPAEEQGRALKAVLAADRSLSVLRHAVAAFNYFGTIDNRSPVSTAWPEWLQVPVLRLRSGFTTAPATVLDGEDHLDVDEETLAWAGVTLRGSLTPNGSGRTPLVIPSSSGDGFEVDDFVQAGVNVLIHDSADVLSKVMVDPPQLRFNFLTPDDWLAGVRPRWEYTEEALSDWLPIGELSSARLRWVIDAIRVVMSREGLPLVLLTDEPERGLHRLAERRLASGLGAMALAREVNVIMATHSPLLLDAKHVRRHFVGRDDRGHARVSDLSIALAGGVDSEHNASELGMTMGDLSTMAKLAIVVEGLHDEWVFSSLLREDIDSVPAGVFPMHGAKRLQSLADARILLEGRDAPVLVILDNLSTDRIGGIWQDAVDSCALEDLEGARRALSPLLEMRKEFGDEYLFLHQLGIRAIELGNMHRLHVHGLSLPDVICYLPVDLVLTSPNMEWMDLIGEWRDAAEKKGSSYATNIKKWLAAKRLLPQTSEQIDDQVRTASMQAARDGEPLHPDLLELGRVIRDVGSRGSHQPA